MINKDFLVITIGKFLQILILLFTIKLSTYYLSPNEMGKFYIIVTFSSLLMLSLFNPIGMYVHRNLNMWKENKIIFNKILFFVLIVLVLATLSSLIIYFYYIYIGINIEFSAKEFSIIVFIYSFFVFFSQFIAYVFNMLHFRLIFTILTISISLFSLFFGYLFIKLFGSNAENWLLGTVVSNMIFMIMGFFILKNRLNEKFNGFFYSFKKIKKEKIKSILVFVLPLSVATLFMWLQNSGYRILIEQNIGLEFLGFLGVGLAISGQIASTIESIVMQYFHPIYYKQITNATIQERKKAIEIFINKALPIYFMLAIFLTFLAKYVVEILVDEKYYGVYVFTTFGIWIEFFRMSSNLFGNISQSEMNTKKFMTPYIIGSLVTVFLVYFSSLKVDYEFYLPIALLIGGLFTMIVMYISMKKLIDFKIDFRLIFFSFLVSLPYFSTYLFNFETNLVLNLLVVGSFGLYFLGTIYFIYKKGLSYGNS
ncbi:hypothetical protein NG744_05050 [Aliarcobacter cryaerophilus]|uniref:lipopolysaccharide biosynthesis protein n=1 Tax=Aliarcobacter cryaerophilus TaxID=28198 RepID=UPI003DA60283